MNWPFDPLLARPSEFNRRWQADPEFRAFAAQVYDYLDRMRPGRLLRLDRYSGRKLEWIVLTAAAYLSEGLNYITHAFTDDYRAISRNREGDETLDNVRRWLHLLPPQFDKKSKVKRK